MNNLKISLAEVSECASRIRILNQTMYELLMNMKKEMDNTNISWISEAGETIRSRFNQFAARFDQQKEIIDTYAKFLDMTVSSYDTLETTINSNASGMQA
ncbi:MAG: pore-forming ESAT-6 family protein [Solobacterium sp.]|nr:pore-forming ESAT-6 family protein [Solobacterium sp.]MBR2669905.1 pore-forming ESAT-6 family protein [Solobacterium sp.]